MTPDYSAAAEAELQIAELDAKLKEWHLDQIEVRDVNKRPVPGLGVSELRGDSTLYVFSLSKRFTYKVRRPSGVVGPAITREAALALVLSAIQPYVATASMASPAEGALA